MIRLIFSSSFSFIRTNEINFPLFSVFSFRFSFNSFRRISTRKRADAITLLRAKHFDVDALIKIFIFVFILSLSFQSLVRRSNFSINYKNQTTLISSRSSVSQHKQHAKRKWIRLGNARLSSGFFPYVKKKTKLNDAIANNEYHSNLGQFNSSSLQNSFDLNFIRCVYQ